jgi:peptide/nickel transport system permease protein
MKPDSAGRVAERESAPLPPVPPVDVLPPPTPLPAMVLRALRHRSLLAGVIVVAAIVALVLATPLLTSLSPTAQDSTAIFQPPSAAHIMGTDSFGRDLFSRVLHGGWYTIGSSALVVLLGGTVGTVLGLVAGYYGGILGYVIMRLVDLLLAFPGILLALAVAAILGPGLLNGVFAVAAVLVPAYARVVEGATIEVRHLPYVDASVTLGSGTWHIIWRHILPGIRSAVIVLTTSWLGIAALWIAALGFIGLGVQPPTPEWGAVLNDGKDYLTVAWWTTVFPGIFLALFVVGVNLVGDGLRDELDPALARK